MSRPVLVTGASKGIGAAIATRLARDGFTIIIHYARDLAGGEATLAAVREAGKAELRHSHRLLSFDISDRAGCRDKIDADMAAHGAYYGVALNAGIARDSPFPAMPDADWDAVLGTNLDGFYNVLKPIVMPMISARRGGRIVTLSSVSGLMGNRGQVNYSAAKAGIIGASKALALELAKRSITVNCVAPGLIDTQMIADVPRDEALKLIPMRRLGLPAEVAAVVSFLCSDDASYVTRQVVSVNGGMC
jgi:3-oxoacyl-[acyl-carrier protein] reductase